MSPELSHTLTDGTGMASKNSQHPKFTIAYFQRLCHFGIMNWLPAFRLATIPAALLLTVGTTAPAFAQAAPVLDFLQRTNAATPPPAAAQIEAAIAAMQEKLKTKEPNGCHPTFAIGGPPQPATADRMIFNAVVGGDARNGWTVQATLSGCRSGTQRFVLALMKDGSLLAIPANEGISLTTSSRFRDTVPLVMFAALAIPALREGACAGKSPERIVTAVAEREADLGPDVFGGRYAGSWRETWTVYQCGIKVAVPVAFTADGDGGVRTRIAREEAKIVK